MQRLNEKFLLKRAPAAPVLPPQNQGNGGSCPRYPRASGALGHMGPYSWMLKSLDLIGAPRNVIELLKKSMKDWKTNLFSGKSPLGAVNINRGTFQGASMLFVITLIPLTLVLRRLKQGYSFGKGKPRLNHLLFMDDLKLYGSSESDIDSLVRTTKLVTEDIEMSFIEMSFSID